MDKVIKNIYNDIETISKKINYGNDVKLVAVTKTVNVETIRKAYKLGLRDFGENRIQEAIPKMQLLSDLKDINWHFIGHLQTNKVKKCKDFYMIQSISSMELLDLLANLSMEKRMNILIEVNSSREPSKSGVLPENIESFFDRLIKKNYHNIFSVRGLMTIGPLTDDRLKIRDAFKMTKKLYDNIQELFSIKFDTLSMGMSNDYDIAIEEGSTMIRIGSKIFGERK
ncbi:MAG: YggS family pyridoxal phosphate-dependent enzyme [Spirochaetes bacterium]|nr:YggS family pyridoxal phosphate-dependent enzyme [Spirochaetota bacterium]HNV43203.1 YggS family pyridoxal phosphate-dependent enzyme [Exilispira sp.]HOV45616.1 YggS family pyridoxal phosphate-dependent enzyme [Exilispira sp.]HQJ40877.1 YggS family pyridoxal phosphate-dependent enzyme [Exilispira sp.]